MATRLQKVAADNGFDVERPTAGGWLAFASTQTSLQIWLTAAGEDLLIAAVSMAPVNALLAEHGTPVQLPRPKGAVGARSVTAVAKLQHLVRRAFQLSCTLPDALLESFTAKTATLPKSTEAERLTIQRVGQDIFRNGLRMYWQERCAATGLDVPELLRASYIKPWARCDSDAERLDVFNGLLLTPNLSAAFDGGVITVGDDGRIMVSSRLADAGRRALGLDAPLTIAHLTPAHHRYLRFHRLHVFRDASAVKA